MPILPKLCKANRDLCCDVWRCHGSYLSIAKSSSFLPLNKHAAAADQHQHFVANNRLPNRLFLFYIFFYGQKIMSFSHGLTDKQTLPVPFFCWNVSLAKEHSVTIGKLSFLLPFANDAPHVFSSNYICVCVSELCTINVISFVLVDINRGLHRSRENENEISVC